MFTLTDGEILRLAPDPAVIDDAPVGRLFRDGRLLVPALDGPVRERRKLSIVGIVIVSFAMSRKGAVLGDPQAHHRRRPGEPTPTATTCSTSCSTRSKARCGRSREKNRKNPESVAESVRRAVRAAVNEAWGKKPICKVLVNVVDTKG